MSLPLVTSPNVRVVDSFPETLGIAGESARTGPYFYVSSLDSISVFDTRDPRHPRLRGTLANLVFENEAMSYGPVKVGDGLSAPLGGFCSAHWFDYHQSGIIAQGYYQQAQAKKTNLVYTTDLVRGLDVFEVDVPSKDLSAASSPLPTLP